MSLNITAKHTKSKRKIGTLHGQPVVELETTGGLHLIVAPDGNSVKVLGTGPHRAVARFIAEKNEPDLRITELSKSDALDPHAMASVLPMWTQITKKLRKEG